MKSGLCIFVCIIIGLGYLEFTLVNGVSKYLVRNIHETTKEQGRRDFRDGKQMILHSGTLMYTEEYHIPKPESVPRVTPEAHRQSQIDYWTQKEGHTPWKN